MSVNQRVSHILQRRRIVLSAYDFSLVNLDKTGVVSIELEESIKE